MSLVEPIDFKYILGRDNYSCVYCHSPLSVEDIDFALVDPDSKAGWSTNNIVVTCGSECKKTSKDPNLPLTWRRGRLIVISGAMYSEKTTTTKSLIHKYTRVKGEYLWVKPNVDTRGSGITTHNKESIDAYIIDSMRPDLSLSKLQDYPIVAFDEIQFYNERILYVIHQLLKNDRIVIANGLRLDARRSLFGVTHYLLGEADDIIPLKSICDICNTIDVATRTKAKSNNLNTVQVGGEENYYAVCPNCDALTHSLE